MDKVFIEGLEIEALIGIYDWERRVRQPLVFDLEMAFDNRRPAASDAITDTLDYKAVSKRLIEFVSHSDFGLVETLAERCAAIVLDEFSVRQVRLKLSKPGAVRGARAVGVIIERSRVTEREIEQDSNAGAPDATAGQREQTQATSAPTPVAASPVVPMSAAAPAVMPTPPPMEAQTPMPMRAAAPPLTPATPVLIQAAPALTPAAPDPAAAAAATATSGPSRPVPVQASVSTPARASAAAWTPARAITRPPTPSSSASPPRPVPDGCRPGTARAYLSLGSNVEPEKNLRAAVAALRARFGDVRMSPVYRTASVGFEGPDFLNAIAVLDSDIHPFALGDWLHALEVAQGRDRRDASYSNRPLDLDIIYFGDVILDGPGELQLPRPELRHAFVLKPLADIAPDYIDPIRRATLAQLWAAHPQYESPPQSVPLDL